VSAEIYIPEQTFPHQGKLTLLPIDRIANASDQGHHQPAFPVFLIVMGNLNQFIYSSGWNFIMAEIQEDILNQLIALQMVETQNPV
jgi:hypothetical protein